MATVCLILPRVRPTGIEVTAGLGHGEFAPLRVMSLPDGTLSVQQVAATSLQDINGDGLVDLVIDRASNSELWYWLNLGNYTLDQRRKISGLPPAQSPDREIRWADLNGNGTTDLIYADSSATPRIQTLDIGELLGSVPRPHLLTGINNGLGRVTHIEYATSTRYLVEDRAERREWKYTLPFPVTVVSRVTVDDSLGNLYVTDFSYHDGYYDGIEKEFRGFEEVFETQYGDETASTTVTRYFYDVGAEEESRKGLLRAQIVTDEDGDCDTPESGCFQHTVNELDTYEIEPGVNYSVITQTTTILYEQTSQPVQLVETYAYDRYGNQTEAVEYGQVCPDEEGRLDYACGADERLTYTDYALNLEKWMVRNPSMVRQTDMDGNFVSATRFFYDGWSYYGLPLGEVERGNLSRQEENLGPQDDNRWVKSVRNRFDNYGNVVGTKDANGHGRTVEFDSYLYTYPTSEIIHLYGDDVLRTDATYDLGYGQIISGTNFNGHVSLFEYDVFGRVHKIAFPETR